MQYEEGATWRPTSAQEQADFGTTAVSDDPGLRAYVIFHVSAQN